MMHNFITPVQALYGFSHMMCLVLEGQQVEVDDIAQTSTKLREMTAHVSTRDDIPSPKKMADVGACRIQVNITGMSCASCVNKIESSLGSKKGKICSVHNLAKVTCLLQMFPW